MNAAERYAEERIAELTKTIAGALGPLALKEIIVDITDNLPQPIAADVVTFARRMAKQLATLIGNSPAA
jgi:mannosyltransferase OCH1-like enzyme